MNGIYERGFMTVHVTPEPGFSYASCELHGFSPKVVHPSKLAAAVATIFEPENIVVACSSSAPLAASAGWTDAVLAVDGFIGRSVPADTCTLAGGGIVRFHSLVSQSCAPALKHGHGRLAGFALPSESTPREDSEPDAHLVA